MFSKAIVRLPCKNIINGLSSSNLGKPDYEKVLLQHLSYVKALEQCGLEVTILDADDNFPDSTFVEDTALLTSEFAIITNPGALSRRGEKKEISKVLKRFYSNIEFIKDPGNVDAGDIMMVGTHFYIGLSKRTNSEGAKQVMMILEKFGLTGSVVSIKNILHLKSGLSYLENNNLVAINELINKFQFAQFNIIKVDADEDYAANCVWINGKVLIAQGFPKLKRTIESFNYKTLEVDVSEFRKLDGGLSCLSLRF